MTNAQGLLVPQYVCPADWNTASITLNDSSLPVILRTGTYVTDQTVLDNIVANTMTNHVAVVYLTIPPMGYSNDPRLSNPNAFYPTPALMAQQLALSTSIATAVNPLNSDYLKMRSFYAALAGRDTKTVNIGMVGASITEGYGVTFDQTQEAQLVRNLRNRYPTSGLSFTQGGRGRIGQAATSTATFPWTYGTTGGGTLGSYDETFHIGANHRTWKMTANGSGTAYTWAKVTLNGAITSFDINYVKTAFGGVGYGYYKIDGGAGVAFDTNAATPTPTKLHVASAATSTIEIGCLNGTMYLDGTTEYNGDENKGIQVHNMGHGSYTAVNWNTNFVAGCWAYSIALLNLDLLILSDMGVNDAVVSIGNRTSAQFKTDLTSFIANLRTAGITCPIVIALNYYVNPASLTYVEPWANYISVMKAIAAADSTIITVDHYSRMPNSTDTTLALYNADQMHCTDKGYGYMADTLTRGIEPK